VIVLVEFTLTNFRSFREPMTLSMEAEPRLSERSPAVNQANLVHTAHGDLLRVAGVYGANGSGKSNLVSAFLALQRLVEAWPGVWGLIRPFALDPTCARRPAELEVVFIAENRQFRYGVAITGQVVVREWLWVRDGADEILAFERDGTRYTHGDAWRPDPALEEKTSPEATHLHVAAEFNHELARVVRGWFRRLRIFAAVEIGRGETMRMLETDKAGVEQFLRGLDLGITGIEIETYEISRPAGSDQPPRTFRDLWFAHRVGSAEPALFSAEQESAGTRKALALAGPVLNALAEGGVLVIDELDAQLHTLLAQQIVRMFQSNDNIGNAQLIFASHDTNLLTRTLLRRDQFWFVEKSHVTQASDLYSLAEIKIDGKKIRNDTDYEADYLRGRYGAIPFFGNLSHLLPDTEQEE
jgi:hypothetical protein